MEKEIEEMLVEEYDEEQAIETAYHEAAHAVAHEVLLAGVEDVTIEATVDYKGQVRPCQPPNPFLTAREDVITCLLAGPAEDARRGDLEAEVQVSAMIEGRMTEVRQPDFHHAYNRAHNGSGNSEEKLRAAWGDAKDLVEKWHEVIEHLANHLVRKWNAGEMPLDGIRVTEFVEHRDDYDLKLRG